MTTQRCMQPLKPRYQGYKVRNRAPHAFTFSNLGLAKTSVPSSFPTPSFRSHAERTQQRQQLPTLPLKVQAAGTMASIDGAKLLLQAQCPPFQPLAGSEVGSFAHGTITQRLPAILDSTCKDMERYLHTSHNDSSKASQMHSAITSILQMREEMLSNAKLPALSCPPTAANPHLVHMVAATNSCLSAWQQMSGQSTWLGLPWLLVECYMYVRISTIIQAQPMLAAENFDPFYDQKLAAFKKSSSSVTEMASATVRLLHPDLQQPLKDRLFEVVQYSLWGNKTDLSLLVDASKITPTELAATAQSQQADGSRQSPFIIVDDFEMVWHHLQSLSGERQLDIVLDNAGLELFGDLCLAECLTEWGLVDKVVFHGKPAPWFVSDVLERDFLETLQECGNCPEGTAQRTWAPVLELAERWQKRWQSGTWQYTQHFFWCTPAPYAWMQHMAPDLYVALSRSALVVLKGDLNYRKLTSDCRWPHTTSFCESLLGFQPAPLLALRTLKADVVAGLSPGQSEQLTQLDSSWLVNGKFGMIQAVL